jgi:hypothetical protein
MPMKFFLSLSLCGNKLSRVCPGVLFVCLFIFQSLAALEEGKYPTPVSSRHLIPLHGGGWTKKYL